MTYKAEKISSIRRFLITSLLLLLTTVIIIIAGINYARLAQQNNHALKLQLANTAKMLDAFITEPSFGSSPFMTPDELSHEQTRIDSFIHEHPLSDVTPYGNYRSNLVYQVWLLGQHNTAVKLLLKSPASPSVLLSRRDGGFGHIKTQSGHLWHTYTYTDTIAQLRIIVALRDTYKRRLQVTIFTQDLAILLLLYLVLTVVLIAIIEIALTPLKRITAAIAGRDATNLTPINTRNSPIEILPLVNELNSLFKQLTLTIDREKQFTADAAHELKTPLAALKTQVEVVKREPNETQRQKLLNNIIKSTNRFAHIVDQLLTLNRLSPNQRLNEMAPCNFSELCEHTVAELAPAAIKRKVELDLQLPEKPVVFSGNATLLGILLRNLLDNAIRYSHKGSEVNVIVRLTKQGTRLRIIDNGPGVSDEELKRIFDRFYRKAGSHADGSGLGLAIVTEIARLHGAAISAHHGKGQHGLEIRLDFKYAKTPDDAT